MRIAAIAGAVVTIILLLGFVIDQAQSIGSLREQRNKVMADLAQSQVDLEAKTRESSALREAHTACLREIEVSQDEQLQARGRISDLELAVKRSQANVRSERTAIYQLPGCAAFTTLDIGSACPDLARSLRRRAAEVSTPR